MTLDLEAIKANWADARGDAEKAETADLMIPDLIAEVERLNRVVSYQEITINYQRNLVDDLKRLGRIINGEAEKARGA